MVNKQTDYQSLLEELQKFGDPWELGDWTQANPNYVMQLQLNPQHVPALLEIAGQWALRDEASGDPPLWAPVHAWRALAQLRCREAVESLLGMLNRLDESDDDWYLTDFPHIFRMIGPHAIPAVSAFLADSRNGDYPRICASGSLSQIAKGHPDTRRQVVDCLTGQLVQFEQNGRTLNGFIVWHLLELDAVESAEVIERAFAAGCVDETLLGGWGDVRRELGVDGLGLAPDEPRRQSASPFGATASLGEKPGGARPQAEPAQAKTRPWKASKRRRS